jgi:hypothetical protein
VDIQSWIGLTVVPVAATLLTVAGPAAATPDSNACSPSVEINSFSDALDKTSFENAFVGNFSALAVDMGGNLLALTDRSSLFTLDPGTKEPTRVVSLTDENGHPLDSEAVAVDGDDTRWITSEVEPSVRHFGTDGEFLGQLPVPDTLRVAPAGRAATNQTFEGLSLQPDARTLIASMEGPLSGNDADVRRFQTWIRKNPAKEFAPGPQYAYRADPGLDISDITPTPDGRLLVVERDFTAGVGNTIHLALADPKHADDVSGVENVTAQSGVRFVEKTVLADLAQCPTLGAPAKQPQLNPLLDNIEGGVVTGSDGHKQLEVVLVSDDNENPSQITRFYSLTVTLPKKA